MKEGKLVAGKNDEIRMTNEEQMQIPNAFIRHSEFGFRHSATRITAPLPLRSAAKLVTDGT
jgi:hypothetical protein